MDVAKNLDVRKCLIDCWKEVESVLICGLNPCFLV